MDKTEANTLVPGDRLKCINATQQSANLEVGKIYVLDKVSDRHGTDPRIKIVGHPSMTYHLHRFAAVTPVERTVRGAVAAALATATIGDIENKVTEVVLSHLNVNHNIS